MAITVHKFLQPYLELELVAGGDLLVNTEFFFLGWFQRHAGYYHCAHSEVSEEKSITTTSGFQSIKCSWWTYHASITAFADAENGQVTVTSVSHGRSEDDSIKIIDTTNYNGTYTITNVTDDTFEITTAWIINDATGTWLNSNSIPEVVTETYLSTSGICFKWDYYSMINSSTNKPYKWLNMNDPNNFGKGEFDEAYGHRKWTQLVSAVNYSVGGSMTWITYSTGSDGLKDGNTSAYSSRGMGHLQVAHRNAINSQGALIDDKWANLKTKLHIKIDDTDTNNNWDDLVTALINSGFTDHYELAYRQTHCNSIIMMASYDGPGVGNWTNISLISPGGWRAINMNYDNCLLRWFSTQYQCRTAASGCISGIFKNTSLFYEGTSMDLYPHSVTADGFSPYGTITFYDDAIGYTLNSGYGGYAAGRISFQFRYPNSGLSYMSDIIANGLYCIITYSANKPVRTLVVDRYEVNNKDLQSYDFLVTYSYMDGKDCDFVWNCTDVSSNRDDGKVIIYFTSLNDPSSYSDIWNFKYNLNLTVVDEEGNPLSDCTVTLVGDETSTDTTDIDGLATVIQLGYTVTCPPNEGSANKYGVASDWKTANLTISKGGFETYTINNIEIREDQDWTITLELSQPSLDSVNITQPTDVDSSDGQVEITASGGNTPYTYSKDGTNYQSSNTFTSLSNGTYDFYVKDVNDFIDSILGIELKSNIFSDQDLTATISEESLSSTIIDESVSSTISETSLSSTITEDTLSTTLTEDSIEKEVTD